MAAPGIKFYPSRDIHLVRGQSIQLINNDNDFISLLRLDDESAFDYVDKNAKMEYSFSYSFAKANAANLGILLEDKDLLSRHPDVTITVLQNEPVDKKNKIRNFYVIAEVRDTDLPVNDKKYKKKAILRIHVHKSINEFWLSPNALNIFKNGGASFSPRVLFDDGCVAELNLATNNRYHILPSIDIGYTTSSPDIIASANGRIFAAGTPPLLLTDVEATLKFGALELKDKALILYAEKLFRPETTRAILVSGSGSPGAAALNEVPNVLFISDGFLREQKNDFKKYVESYVKELMENKITAPFKWLKGKINFWMLFLPSFESGISTYSEFVVKEEEDENNQKFLTGKTVPFAKVPDSDIVIAWSLENLIYKVGLPAVNESAISDEELKNKWQETTTLTNVQILALLARNALIKKWKKLAHRKLTDLKNTALSVTIDRYTAATEDGNEDLIDFDDRRFERNYLDTLFADLKDDKGNTMGTPFLYNEVLRGKDFDNIIVLCGAQYGRAVNGDGYMFSTLGDTDAYPLSGTLADHRVKIKDAALPEKLPLARKKTITHELCHSFGLGDEYGEYLENDHKKPAAEVASRFGVAPVHIDNLDDSANIQRRNDLEVKVANSTEKQIQSYKIKWRYHRIQKCGEVTNIIKSGDVLTLTLKDGHTKNFNSANKIIIRKRQATNKNYFIIDRVSNEILASILEPMPNGTRNMRSTIFSFNPTKTEIVIDPIDKYKFKVVPLLPDKIIAGKAVEIQKRFTEGPIHSIFRIDNTTIPPILVKAISPPLTIQSIDLTTNTIRIDLAGVTLIDYLTFINNDNRVLAYHPMPVDNDPVAFDYPYYELISQKILNDLLAHPHPYNTNILKKEIIDNEDISRISSLLVPCCSRHKKQIIGLYAGGHRYHSGVYHPAARCMMRSGIEGGKYVELCAVCQYTLINLINPVMFKEFDEDYINRKLYP